MKLCTYINLWSCPETWAWSAVLASQILACWHTPRSRTEDPMCVLYVCVGMCVNACDFMAIYCKISVCAACPQSPPCGLQPASVVTLSWTKRQHTGTLFTAHIHPYLYVYLYAHRRNSFHSSPNHLEKKYPRFSNTKQPLYTFINSFIHLCAYWWCVFFLLLFFMDNWPNDNVGNIVLIYLHAAKVAEEKLIVSLKS